MKNLLFLRAKPRWNSCKIVDKMHSRRWAFVFVLFFKLVLRVYKYALHLASLCYINWEKASFITPSDYILPKPILKLAKSRSDGLTNLHNYTKLCVFFPLSTLRNDILFFSYFKKRRKKCVSTFILMQNTRHIDLHFIIQTAGEVSVFPTLNINFIEIETIGLTKREQKWTFEADWNAFFENKTSRWLAYNLLIIK